jgi:GTPase SAR1 family protein
VIFTQIILGNHGVGKRSILRKLIGKEDIIQNISGPLGINSCVHKIHIDKYDVTFQFWILGSKPRSNINYEALFAHILSCTLVFDVSDRKSFHAIASFADEVIKYQHKRIPLIMVGNKVDLRDKVPDAVSYEEGKTYARELTHWWTQEVYYVETSVSNENGIGKLDEYYRSILRTQMIDSSMIGAQE